MRFDAIYSSHSFSPKALIQLFLIVGLLAFTVSLLKQQLVLAFSVALLPILFMAIGYGFTKPRLILFFYAAYSFFFTTAMRYAHVSQLSAGLDMIVFYGMIALLIASYQHKGSISWKCAVNTLTISYIPWVLFCIIQLSNPNTPTDGVVSSIRIHIFRTICLYTILSVLANTSKALKVGLDIISAFTFLAFIKLLWQKYIGFDSAELHWLYVEEAARTHIIHSGIRYFSYFSDAANFGGYMAAAGLVYGIIGIHYKKSKRKMWYIFISIASFIGMFMSGTRGAMVIPLSALMLYCLLCKNFRILIITALTGLIIYFFFAFTNIGNNNEYIRRARTAFESSKDASMNVRLRNREEIAIRLANHPLGYGFKGTIEKLWPNKDGTYTQGNLPPDSYFVHIWIETGYFGLTLYIIICGLIIIDCCRIVLFCIKDKQLRHTIAAFTCATLGIWASGYTGDNPGMPPTDFVIASMIAFVMNGATIDKEITQKKLLTTKTNNAI